MTIFYIKYLSLYYALAYPLENSSFTIYQINSQSVLVESHKYREACSFTFKIFRKGIPCPSNFSAGDKKLTSTYIQCKHVILHVIVLPLRLLGLIIVRVVLMKKPLLKVSCPTIDEEISVRVSVLPTS